MPEQAVERKLVAILAADVAGYSRLVGLDEERTLARLKALRLEIIDPEIASHRGRIVKTTGDGLLVEFVSVVDAVRCAVAVQRVTTKHQASMPHGLRIELRVGINVGDIIVDGDDILGDGVNIAARLEGIADPGSICISDDVYRQVRGRVDVEFSDLGEQKLKNIAQPVRAFRIMLGKSAMASARSLPLPDKPSIAVLPFQNMSGDPEQEYFADGMVEEIITALSRIRSLFVIARNSSFTYKGQIIDVKRVGRELGVRYVLEGSVRRGGGRVRITAQLIEAETGAHLWADRFDGSLDDVFDLQDQVAASVAGVIESAVQNAEIRRAVGRPTSDLTAYDFYLRALPHCFSWDAERVRSALDLLERAIERDNTYGRALVLAGICHHHLEHLTEGAVSEAHKQAALDYARRALRASPDDPGTINDAAFLLGYFDADITAAITLADRALTLNPSYARGWASSGYLRLWAGDPETAIQHLETACRLNPRQGNATYRIGIGYAQFVQRRFDDAIETLHAASLEIPGNPTIYRFLTSCYAHTGRIEEARKTAARLKAIAPRLVHQRPPPFRIPEHRELYLSGLRLVAEETE